MRLVDTVASWAVGVQVHHRVVGAGVNRVGSAHDIGVFLLPMSSRAGDTDGVTTAALPATWSRRLSPVVVVVLSGVCAALVWHQHGPWYDWLGVGVCLEFAVVWALLRTDPVLSPNARTCLAAALLVVANNVGFDHNGPAWVVNVGLRTVAAVPFAILLLRYPYLRIVDRVDRVFVGVAIVWTIASQLLLEVTWTPPARYHEWWPTLVHGNRLAWVNTVVDSCDIAVVVVGLVLVARRPVRARGLDRRELWPVAVAGAVVAVGAVGTVVGYTFVHGGWASALAPASAFAYLFIPVSFLVVALQRKLSRARLVELTTSIGSAQQLSHGPLGLRTALRQALADPTLDILYWVDEGWVDEDGLAATLDAQDRLVLPVAAHDGSPLASLVAYPGLERHRDLVDAVVTAARLALENARLHTALLAQLAEVRSAQHRIVEAGLDERRRIERDLHDGAQQRLLAASMTLARVRETSSDPLVELASAQLKRALDELRDLARGIHPAVLSQSGLAVATESLVEHSPLAVIVDLPAQRWPPGVESAAYFVIAEGLANAAKHAPHAQVFVAVADSADGLVVRVRDDGPGSARFSPGGGLAGLADRVRALGGTFVLESVVGEGTSMTAVIPCG